MRTTYREAVRAALREALQKDPRVFLRAGASYEIGFPEVSTWVR